MNIIKKISTVSISIILINIMGCQGGSIPVPSSTASSSASSSNSNPSPSATSTPVGQYSYDLPLKVTEKGECSLGDRTAFEVKTDGTFSYLNDDMTKTESRKLTDSEMNSLKGVINEINLAKLAEQDTILPPGSPQTEECRTVEYFSMVVNGQEKTFDRNARLRTHTTEYITAIEKLKTNLETLKITQPQSYTYSLPLKVINNGECDLPKNVVSHEIKEDGTYNYLTDNNVMSSKKLSQSQINDLNNLLKEIDIAKLAEQNTAVEPGSPQTKECRTVENFVLRVNGTEKTFDRNSRELIHTQAYLDAINKLKTRLEDLKK